jgi:hypothetical protein
VTLTMPPGILLAGALIAGLSFATSAASAEAQAGPAQCGQGLDFLLGKWDVSAREPGAAHAERFDYEIKPLVGSAWLYGRAKSADLASESSDVWGKDASSGEIIRVIFDKSGTYALIRSPGWKDGRLVLEGDALSSGGSIRVRETISCISRDEFRALWEARRDGVWRAYSDEHVVRRRS